MKTTRKQLTAFTVIELLIVIAALSILAALIMPELARRQRSSAQRINCTNNLKQIGLAFRTWSLDNNDKFPTAVSVTNGGAMEMVSTGGAFAIFLVMSNELSTPKLLICPEEEDRRRIAASTFSSSVPPGASYAVPFTNNNNLSYFAGIDAQDTYPQLLLSGDRNLSVGGRPVKPGLVEIWTNSIVSWSTARHSYGGTIGLADGSVQQVSSSRLRKFFIQTGFATNRLAVP